jgi:hypothetical protein
MSAFIRSRTAEKSKLEVVMVVTVVELIDGMEESNQLQKWLAPFNKFYCQWHAELRYAIYTTNRPYPVATR